MINVKDKKCINCLITLSTFGVVAGKATHCFQCKEDDMFDVNSRKRCKTYGCGKRIDNDIYKGHCLRCFIHLYPNETLSKQYKIKENHASDYLQSELPQYNHIFDKIIQGGCSRRRPDDLIDLLTML